MLMFRRKSESSQASELDFWINPITHFNRLLFWLLAYIWKFDWFLNFNWFWDNCIAHKVLLLLLLCNEISHYYTIQKFFCYYFSPFFIMLMCQYSFSSYVNAQYIEGTSENCRIYHILRSQKIWHPFSTLKAICVNYFGNQKIEFLLEIKTILSMKLTVVTAKQSTLGNLTAL